MRLPSNNSRGAKALACLYADGACTIEQAIVRHAGFGLLPASIHDIYDRLEATGCADFRCGVYSISKPARRHFDQMVRPAAEPGKVTGPVYRAEPKPLDVARTRMVETRPGALDYRAIPSLVGSMRVPFKGVAPGEGFSE